MFTCLALASALIIGHVDNPGSRTVMRFDNQVFVSQSVLNRSACKKIVTVQPELKTREDFLDDKQYAFYLRAVESRRIAQRDALVTHCKNRLRSQGLNESECELAIK
jgi:hypothetical protein